MKAHRVMAIGIALAGAMSIGADPSGPNYSLEELREIARSVHPALESVKAAVAASMGELRQETAFRDPEITVVGGRGRPRSGGDSRSEYAIELVQSFEFPGSRKWRTRAAELGVRGAEFERAVAESIVDTAVAGLAYTVLLETRRAEVARESAQVARRLHELLRRRVDVGESSPLEAVKAEAEWFARRRDVLDADAAAAAARSSLNLFCGGQLHDAFEIVDPLESVALDELPANLAERLRTGNPLLLRAGLGIEEAEARSELANKRALPRIDLIAGQETELDRTAFSFGVGLSIPLWNRNRGATEAAVAERHRSFTAARSLTLELETTLARASARYRRALSAIRLHREGWTEAARKSLDVASFSFRNGEASLLDVLDAQRSYLGVKLAKAESWAALALARAEIEYLIGGPLKMETTHAAR